MSASGSGVDDWRASGAGHGWLRIAIVLVAFAALVLASGTAAAADTEAPEWGNATKVNATAIDVTFYDNGTLDTGTITRDDFVLTTGRIGNFTVRSIDASGANRTGARATLVLENRLDVDNVTIGLRSGATISDDAGNSLSDGSVTASGMDTVSPVYRSFAVTRVNSSTAEIALEVHEPLSNLTVSIGGPSIDRLDVSNFTAEIGETATYTSRYTFPEEGEYSLLLLSATDRSNNSIRLGRLRKFRYDSSAPNVTLDGPTNTTVGEAVNFTAVNSTDDQRIESFQWRIDGGTILPGESVTVAFATPGTHEISVEVTDPFGNAAVATRTVTVSGADARGDVTVTRSNRTHATATVDTTGYSQRIQRSNGSLVAGSNASLERLRGSFQANETVTLGLRATDRVPPSFATATGEIGLVRLDVDHGNVSAESVSFTFAVERAALNRSGVDPEAVTLYRDDGGWVPLSTTLVSRQGSHVRYQARAPGLSTFVVGGRPSQSGQDSADAETPSPTPTDPSTGTADAGQPQIVVTNVTVRPESPTAGEQAILTVALENRGTATGDYVVTVFLNGSDLTRRTVTVPAGQSRTTEFARELPGGGPLEVGTQRVANVSSGGGGFALGTGGLALPSLPNPLSLWPSGLIGAVLTGLVAFLVGLYSVLKALAIYLGY